MIWGFRNERLGVRALPFGNPLFYFLEVGTNNLASPLLTKQTRSGTQLFTRAIAAYTAETTSRLERKNHRDEKAKNVKKGYLLTPVGLLLSFSFVLRRRLT